MRMATATWARRMSNRQVKYCRKRKHNITDPYIHPSHVPDSHKHCSLHICATEMQQLLQSRLLISCEMKPLSTANSHTTAEVLWVCMKIKCDLHKNKQPDNYTVLSIFVSYQSKQAADFIDGSQTSQKSQKHGEWAHTNQNIRDHLQDHGWLLC